MRIARKLLTVATLLLLIAGCGSGDKDKVGNLTVDVTSAALAGQQYSVSALATYTNPNKTSLEGTEITFETSTTVPGFPVTVSTPTNGKTGINFIINQGATPKNFFVIARTGDLEDSKAVSIPALGALTATPSTLTFTSTEVSPSAKAISISGGTSPYTASSNEATLATVSVSGNTATVTRQSNNTGTAVITIKDSASAQASTTVSVTLQ